MIVRVVIVCGDRNWLDRRPIRRLLESLDAGEQTVIITGGAAGADTIAFEESITFGHRNIKMDAPWRFHGKRGGPIRNGWMLDILLTLQHRHPSAVCEVHAFHDHIAASKGTADMLGRARTAGIPHTIHTTTDE